MKSCPIFVWSIVASTQCVISIDSLSLVEPYILRQRRSIIANDSRLTASLRLYPSHNEHDERSSQEDSWQKVSEISKLTTPWFSLLGERLRDHENKLLDYWRVERADSAVVLVLHCDCILLPRPMYRPGVQLTTLDFCGGRIDAGNEDFQEDASAIVERELQVTANDIESIQPLNPDQPWPVNSSFSNQCLYGFVCKLKDEAHVDNKVTRAFPNTRNGRHELLAELACLQCRAVLLEYMFQHEE